MPSVLLSIGSLGSIQAVAHTQPAWRETDPRLRSLWFTSHPTDSNTIYVGAAQGGVWKTTNGGTSWAPLTDGQCSRAMGSIAIDP